MRSTPRLYVAAILLNAAVVFASAQEAGAPLPPPAPDAGAPVAELPPLPVGAGAGASVAELPPLPVVVAPSAFGPEAPAVDPAVTIDPSVLSVAPAGAPTVRVSEPEIRVAATNTGRATKKAGSSTLKGSTPDHASGNTAPGSDAPAPAAARSAIPETPAESGSRARMIIAEWVLAGVLIVTLFSVFSLLRSRSTRPRSSIVDIPVPDAKLKPAALTRS